MTAIQLLATLGLTLLLPAAHATTAVVFSESTGRYGVAWNEPGKETAIQKATEDCRYRGGGKDCKPVKVSDTHGFGTVAQTCAGGFCGISIITGRRSAAEAERDAVKDCNANYGTRDCRAYDNWQETGAATPVAKAPSPSNPPPQSKPPMPTPSSGEAPIDTGLSSAQMAQIEATLKLSGEGFQRAIAKLQTFTLASMRKSKMTPAQSSDWLTELSNRDNGEDAEIARAFRRLGDTQEQIEKFLSNKRVAHEEASKLYGRSPESACNGGNAKDCFTLGRMYAKGDGIRQDKQKAAQFFDKACGLEDNGGCYYLGRMYEQGDGIRQDKQKAAQLFDKVCSSESAPGCYALGWMYKKGDGIRQDKQKAAQLYDKACGLRFRTGCGALGLMYEIGDGIRQDKQKAVQLYDKACDFGDSTSCEDAKKLRSGR